MWQVGMVWRQEVTWSEDIELTSGKTRLHKRIDGHTLVELRALKVWSEGVSSYEMHVIEDETTTTDLIGHGRPVVERDPIAGGRFVRHAGEDGNVAFAITREGAKVSATDARNVEELADLGDLAVAMPDHPLAIGDSFSLSRDPSNPHQGTARLERVVGGIAELSVERTWTLPTSKVHESGTWRIRVADGRTASYALTGTTTHAPIDLDGKTIVAKPEATTRAVIYTYVK
jgi:hypothetical protein